MTHKRVVFVVISLWVYSAFVSSIILWGLRSTRDAFGLVSAVVGFILTFVLYIKIYHTVRRHKSQIQSMQIREEAQSDEIKNFAAHIKSTVGVFYVYLVHIVCYVPFQIFSAAIRFHGSSIAMKKCYLLSVTLIFLNSSLNPVIYCWKMRHIRRAIMEIIRNVSRRRHPARFIHHGSRTERCAQ